MSTPQRRRPSPARNSLAPSDINASLVPSHPALQPAHESGLDSITKAGSQRLLFRHYTEQLDGRYLRGLDQSSTAAIYLCGLNLRVLPRFGDVPVHRISTGLIEKTIDDWERELSTSSVKAAIAVLTRVLDEAVRDELIATNPARARLRRRSPRSAVTTRRRIPTPAQVCEIAAACRMIHPSYGDFVMATAYLATRTSETAGLRVGDVDGSLEMVTINRQFFPGSGGLLEKPPKGGIRRVVPILDRLRPVLRRLTSSRAPEQPLIRGPRGGVLTPGTFARATRWNDLVRDFGFPGLRRHDLRHAGATWFANSGVPLHVVQEILGHASLETTKSYLHPGMEQFRAAAKRTDEFIAKRT